MATPCSPNAVCDPPSACSQPAWAAGAERGRPSCPVPANRLRPQGHLGETPPLSPRGKRISVGLVRGAAGTAWNVPALAGGQARECSSSIPKMEITGPKAAQGDAQDLPGILGAAHGLETLAHPPVPGQSWAEVPGPCPVPAQPRSPGRGARAMPGASTAPFPTLPSRCVGTGRNTAKHRAGQDQKHQSHTNKS